MSIQKRTCVGLVVVVTGINTALLLGCEGGRPKEPTAEVPAPVDTTLEDPGKAPPIPEAGPLASPRSLQQIGLPIELTRSLTPPDNPQTPEKIALGQKLFFDGRLSADSSVACATCHNPARAFTDGRPTSVGIHGHFIAGAKLLAYDSYAILVIPIGDPVNPPRIGGNQLFTNWGYGEIVGPLPARIKAIQYQVLRSVIREGGVQ